MYCEEEGYVKLVKDVKFNGSIRTGRNGEVKSLFGVSMKFSLRENVLPLLTVKRTSFHCIIRELLWFISGSTNSNVLKNWGVNIWDYNTSKSRLEELGLTYAEGDAGPIYGYQWRHFGEIYESCYTKYGGFDQLAHIIELIKRDPTSRRIVMSSWNPCDILISALPPCHVLVQFYVDKGKLSCQMYQRSADIGLGLPFNIASYGILTRLIAYVCDLECDELRICIGEAHIYMEHLSQLYEACELRPLYTFPCLMFDANTPKNIDDIEEEHLYLLGYTCNPQLRLKFIV